MKETRNFAVHMAIVGLLACGLIAILLQYIYCKTFVVFFIKSFIS